MCYIIYIYFFFALYATGYVIWLVCLLRAWSAGSLSLESLHKKFCVSRSLGFAMTWVLGYMDYLPYIYTFTWSTYTNFTVCVGHGPFSHLFQDLFIPHMPPRKKLTVSNLLCQHSYPSFAHVTYKLYSMKSFQSGCFGTCWKCILAYGTPSENMGSPSKTLCLLKN